VAGSPSPSSPSPSLSPLQKIKKDAAVTHCSHIRFLPVPIRHSKPRLNQRPVQRLGGACGTVACTAQQQQSWALFMAEAVQRTGPGQACHSMRPCKLSGMWLRCDGLFSRCPVDAGSERPPARGLARAHATWVIESWSIAAYTLFMARSTFEVHGGLGPWGKGGGGGGGGKGGGCGIWVSGVQKKKTQQTHCFVASLGLTSSYPKLRPYNLLRLYWVTCETHPE
jgi:hypothetical protein